MNHRNKNGDKHQKREKETQPAIRDPKKETAARPSAFASFHFSAGALALRGRVPTRTRFALFHLWCESGRIGSEVLFIYFPVLSNYERHDAR